MLRDADLITIVDDKGLFFQSSSHLILGDDHTVATYIEESIVRLNQMEAKLKVLRHLSLEADMAFRNNPEWERIKEQAKAEWEAI